MYYTRHFEHFFPLPVPDIYIPSLTVEIEWPFEETYIDFRRMVLKAESNGVVGYELLFTMLSSRYVGSFKCVIDEV